MFGFPSMTVGAAQFVELDQSKGREFEDIFGVAGKRQFFPLTAIARGLANGTASHRRYLVTGGELEIKMALPLGGRAVEMLAFERSFAAAADNLGVAGVPGRHEPDTA